MRKYFKQTYKLQFKINLLIPSIIGINNVDPYSKMPLPLHVIAVFLLHSIITARQKSLASTFLTSGIAFVLNLCYTFAPNMSDQTLLILPVLSSTAGTRGRGREGLLLSHKLTLWSFG